MEIEDYRWSALARYHDAALDSAVVLFAITRRSTHSHFDIGFQNITDMRSVIRTMTEMHAFCINARKAIEIADIVSPGIKKCARQMCPHDPGTIVNDPSRESYALTNSSFWWILARIIHSVSVVVFDESEAVDATQTRIYSVSRERYFGFSSDRDAPTGGPGSYVITTSHTHFVGIEEFIRCYTSTISHQIDAAIKILRPKLDMHHARS